METTLIGQSGLSLENNINLGIQVILLIIIAIYSIYALVVFKQVRILNKSIHTTSAGLLNFLARLHLGVSLTLLIIVILLILF